MALRTLTTHTRTLLLAFFVVLLAAACTREVEVPVEKVVEVPVEKIVEVERVVEVTVEKIVEVVPTPAPTPSPGPRIFKMGIFEEPITRNFWNYYGGPGGSVWTQYALDGVATSLYTYSDQRFDWVPLLADGFPSALVKEEIGGDEFWTTSVSLRAGVTWSDGVEITADDFAFVVQTVLDFELASNWATAVDSAFVDRVEVVDTHTAKIYFKGTDAEGNPQTPGLSVWQFGLALAPILAKHYWEPIADAAKSTGEDAATRQAALFAHVPDGEPTAGGFVFGKSEPGAFLENRSDADWFRRGTKVIEYASGAYRETGPSQGRDVTYYGEAAGPTTLEFEVGPHVESTLFSVYSNQDAAILALEKGDIDYLFNPFGLEAGFRDRVERAPDLEVLANASNGLRYLGFNTRKAPMSNKAFRQAVATVIDKEFIAGTILQGAALPVYAMVPKGNAFWHNSAVPEIGRGLSRADRVAQAVERLKAAGFTYEREPRVSQDGLFVEVIGEGLRMPDGTLVPELSIIGPSAGYDPLRATFNIWIERWLNDIGISVRARLTSINSIVGVLFSENVAEDLDMWIFGWSFDLFPAYLESFFNSRHAVAGDINWGGYSNAEYDQLSSELLTETDLAEARKKVLRLQEFLADELPYVTLFTTPVLDTYRPGTVHFPYTEVLGGVQFINGLQQEVLFE